MSDKARMDYLEDVLRHEKWADVLPNVRPTDAYNIPLAKYIGEDGWTLRAAIDRILRDERDRGVTT